MKRPPEGLCLKCELVEVRDADTVVVSILDGRFRPAIRLIDCWAPEKNTERGKFALDYVKSMLEAESELYLWIPAPHNLENLLRNLTFDRIPGHIFLRKNRSLSEHLVNVHLAGSTKETQPPDNL